MRRWIDKILLAMAEKIRPTQKLAIASPMLSIELQGQYAKELNENPIFQQVIKTIEKHLIDKWASSPVRDAEGREKIFFRLEALRKIESEITGLINEAAIDKHIREEKQKEESNE